ncbi:L,D-transpeptidase family protein [Streptomyces sp. NPDC058655]|uniref:L,D-transpeptidase family protein n=1 Tax=Streptomyces sp. NPDC058655 TaxID=3346577 RepID=UPI003649D298
MRARLAVPAAVLAMTALAALAGCAGAPSAATEPAPAGDGAGRRDAVAQGGHAADIPGLGPATKGGLPADASQAVVVTGEGPDSSTSTVALYARDPARGWHRAGPAGSDWPAHNALRGWTDRHTAGDLRSPVGVFGLTDAGGLLDDPGSRLPYERASAFTIGGTGSLGEPLAGSFDYVVAINYNRRAGTSPLDRTRPLGEGRGGGIWFHVDHGGPTQGCVSLAEPQMAELLRWLDPDRHPVVVMGDAASLLR